MEKVVLVDEQDREIGTEEKLKAHMDGGKLHRAISVFVFDSKHRLLLQKRAAGKYHAPNLWSNTCCTHPRPGESPEDAASRRLDEEMGIRCRLQKIAEKIYKADVGGGLTEYEYDHMFIGFSDSKPKPNPEEVSDYKWVSLEELQADIEKNPESYTPWFRILLPIFLEEVKKVGGHAN